MMLWVLLDASFLSSSTGKVTLDHLWQSSPFFWWWPSNHDLYSTILNCRQEPWTFKNELDILWCDVSYLCWMLSLICQIILFRPIEGLNMHLGSTQSPVHMSSFQRFCFYTCCKFCPSPEKTKQNKLTWNTLPAKLISTTSVKVTLEHHSPYRSGDASNTI